MKVKRIIFELTRGIWGKPLFFCVDCQDFVYPEDRGFQNWKCKNV